MALLLARGMVVSAPPQLNLALAPIQKVAERRDVR